MSVSNTDEFDNHDESYFASFTDLLVGVLFIFIILLMVFASNFSQAVNEVTGIKESRDKVLQEIKRSMQEQGVEVSIDLEQGILRLPDKSVEFDRGEAIPKPAGKEALIKLSKILDVYLPCLTQNGQSLDNKTCSDLNLKNRNGLDSVLIEGHTDRHGSDTGYDNWGLSARRAITVFQILTQSQPSLDHDIVNNKGLPVLAVSGYEARRPVSETNLDLNRRIDLRFIMRSPTPEEVTSIQNSVEK